MTRLPDQEKICCVQPPICRSFAFLPENPLFFVNHPTFRSLEKHFLAYGYMHVFSVLQEMHVRKIQISGIFVRNTYLPILLKTRKTCISCNSFRTARYPEKKTLQTAECGNHCNKRPCSPISNNTNTRRSAGTKPPRGARPAGVQQPVNKPESVPEQRAARPADAGPGSRTNRAPSLSVRSTERKP
jgi:hypothetical protein